MEDDKPTGEEAKTPENPAPQWEYRTNMKVVERMRNIVNLTIDASKAEIAQLRRKIEKLQYGG